MEIDCFGVNLPMECQTHHNILPKNQFRGDYPPILPSNLVLLRCKLVIQAQLTAYWLCQGTLDLTFISADEGRARWTGGDQLQLLNLMEWMICPQELFPRGDY